MIKLSEREKLYYIKHSELPLTYKMFGDAMGVNPGGGNIQLQLRNLRLMPGGEEIYTFMPSGSGGECGRRKYSLVSRLGHEFPKGFIIDGGVEIQERNLARLICARLYERNKDILSAPGRENDSLVISFVRHLGRSAYPEIHRYIRELDYGRSPEAHDDFSRSLLKLYGLDV